MLYSYYFPLADLRSCTGQRAELVSKPSWPLPSVGDSVFQRNLGVVANRPLGGVRGWIGESYICELGPSVALSNGTSDKLFHPLRKAFKRFYYDGFGSGYFSIGVAAKSITQWDRSRLGELHAVLDQAKFSLTFKQFEGGTPINQASDRLAELYERGTQFGNVKSSIRDSVFCGPPISIISLKMNELEAFLTRSGAGLRDVFEFSNDGYVMRLSTPTSRSSTFLLVFERNDQARRFSRLALARLYSEFHLFERMIDILSSRHVQSIDGDGADWLASRLNLSLVRLTGRKSPSFSTQEGYYSMMVEAFSTLHKPGRVDDFIQGLRTIGVRTGLARRVVNHALKQFDVKESTQIIERLVMGDFINKGDKNVVQGDNFGTMGSRATGQHSATKFVGPDGNPIDLSILASELGDLLNSLKEQASSSAEMEDLTKVAAAKEAAEAGDGEQTRSMLSKVGKWVVDNASKIGVGLATAALKVALGI